MPVIEYFQWFPEEFNMLRIFARRAVDRTNVEQLFIQQVNFQNRSHCIKFHGEFSNFLNILASVIQGSVIGPASYAIHAGDLRPITDGNDMVKYADDTYLVASEVNSTSCEDELNHIDQWAT